MTLVSGGAAAVNTASLTIVTQPSSGSATAAAELHDMGSSPTRQQQEPTGSQTLTFAYCTPGNTYPSAGNCTTATITYAVSVGEYLGANVGNITGLIQDVQTAISLPATAVQGSTVTASIAPVATSVPASDDGITVNSAAQFSVVMPVPKGFTYVPGSIRITGGDATTSGHLTATYCTGPVANACTAQIASGNYKTVYPYIETFLNPGTTVAGGGNVTLPTVTAQFTATGDVGTVQPLVFTEFVLVTSVQIVGTLTFDGYPSCSACANGNNPTYQAPSPLASTTITSAPPTRDGHRRLARPPARRPEAPRVTITGTDLSGATAVDFGSTPGTITADSDTSITATAPPGTGAVDVTVTTPDGTSGNIVRRPVHLHGGAFRRLQSPPSARRPGRRAVGTHVTVTGTNLSGATAVDFGSTPGTITADSSTSVTATSPAGTGTVDVTVATPSGVSAPVVGRPVLVRHPGADPPPSWTDPQACGISATTTVPALASKVIATLVGGSGGGGGGAASSDSGGSGGPGSSVVGHLPGRRRARR